MNEKHLKALELIIESAYKLERKLSTCVMTLKLERETHVPDLMTRIRILPSVAVVAQKDKVARFFDGDAQLKIGIKFLAKTDDILKSIKQLAKMIKGLPGVKIISIDEFNKRKLTLKGSKIVF
jgi:hypothetical protein